MGTLVPVTTPLGPGPRAFFYFIFYFFGVHFFRRLFRHFVNFLVFPRPVNVADVTQSSVSWKIHKKLSDSFTFYASGSVSGHFCRQVFRDTPVHLEDRTIATKTDVVEGLGPGFRVKRNSKFSEPWIYMYILSPDQFRELLQVSLGLLCKLFRKRLQELLINELRN